MTHKKITRFQMEGEFGPESNVVRLKEKYVQTLIGDMRLAGYVPHLALDPAFSTNYDEKSKTFAFLLTIHGVYVGKKNAQTVIYAVDGLKEIPME